MGLDNQVFAVIDTETTGLDPEKDELVEIACVATSVAHPLLGAFVTLVKPNIPIPPEVSAVHGITDVDVIGAPGAQTALNELGTFLGRFWGHNGDFFVPTAHNADFDICFVPGVEPREKWLCTKRLAKHLWPDYPAHKNQSLRYRRHLRLETFGIAAHRALGDALVTAALLRDALTSPEFEATEIEDAQQLLEYAESGIPVDTWPFGKFYQQPIEAADTGYIRWALENAERVKNDRDLRFTLETELQKRQTAA